MEKITDSMSIPLSDSKVKWHFGGHLKTEPVNPQDYSYSFIRYGPGENTQ